MRYRTFADRVSVSALGLGCGRVGSINNPVPMREINATLEAAVEAGVNLFDTADIYGQGDSERTLGRLMARHPGRLFVVTKVGFVHGPLASYVRIAKPLLRALSLRQGKARNAMLQTRAAMMKQDFSADYLRAAVDRSRRRLGIDRLDGVLLHSPPPQVLQSQEVHDLLRELVRQKKASHVGVSATSVDEVDAAVTIPAVTMIQLPSTVAARLDSALVERARERKIALFVREILARPEDAEHDETRKRSPGAALTTALAPPFVTAAIVGVSTRAHLKDFLSVMT